MPHAVPFRTSTGRAAVAASLAVSLATVLMLGCRMPSAHAAPVLQVFSGDHRGFSRLAVRLPRGMRDEVRRQACSARVVLSGDEVGWPLAELNGSWIRRMWDFRTEDGGRTLAFDWPCGSLAHVWREGDLLIVDVSAPPVPTRKPVRDAGALVADAAAGSEPAPDSGPDSSAGPAEAAWTFEPPALVAGAQAAEAEDEGGAPVSPSAGPEIPEPVPPQPEPEPAAEPVPESASQRVEIAAADPAEPPAAPSGETPPPIDVDLDAVVRKGVLDALDLLESGDGEQQAAESVEPEPSAPEPAVPEPAATEAEVPRGIGLLDVTEWAGDDFAGRRRELELAAGGETGPARTDALLALARFHLAWATVEEGLGAVEAAGATRATGGTDLPAGQRHQLRVVEDALRILDGSADPETTVFVRRRPVDSSDHLLWRAAALAGRGTDAARWSEARASLPEALRRLLSYPGELRERLLVRLADGAAAMADADSLDRLVIEMITLDGEDGGERLDWYRGRAADLRGQVEAALARYDRASQGTGPFARRAQLRAVELRHERGLLDGPGTIAALERLRYAWRGDDVEAAALQGLGEAYLEIGKADLALSMLDRLGRRFAGDERGRAATASAGRLIRALVGRAEPGDVLVLARRHGTLVARADADGSLRRDLAAALAGEGFAVEARRLLTALVEEAGTHPRTGTAAAMAAEVGADLAGLWLRAGRAADALATLAATDAAALSGEVAGRRGLLEAEALMQAGRHLEALGALRGLTGPEPARLRARTLFTAGEWRAAQAAYAEAMSLAGPAGIEADDAARFGLAAFRAGDLPGVRDAAVRYRHILDGTRWAGLLDVLAPAEGQAPAGPLAEDTVTRELGLAGDLIGLSRRWAEAGTVDQP